MTDDDPPTPSLDLPRPDFADDSEDMAARIAWRLFPAISEEPRQSKMGHYKILRLLGTGGMGVVYAAEDQDLRRIVALKVLRSNSMLERERRRLIDEARALAKLSHPNVVQIYEVGEHDDVLYIAMEHVKGKTLAHWQHETPGFEELLDVYIQAGAGLIAAHAAGIIHRDFKPANVLVGDDGRVRVADFGLALPGNEEATTDKIPTLQNQSTSSQHLVGTLGYLAPELFYGSSATESSDQFSFCSALWEGIAGMKPFETSTFITSVEAGRLPELRGRVRPWWLRRALLRGLTFEPGGRWRTLADLLRYIERGRRIRRIARIVVPLSLALMVPAAFVITRDPEYRSCEAPAAGFDDVWNDERKAELLADDDPVSARAIAAELDRYSESWSFTRQEICEAHFERGDLSAEGLDLAQGCLRSIHDRAHAVVDTLLDGDDRAERADDLLDSLPPPQVCQDLRLQRARPLATIARFGSASAARSELEEIELMLARGEYARARESSEALLATMADTDSTPEYADALVLLGLAERRLGELEAASGHLESAAVESELAGHAEAGFRALRELAELATYDLDDPDLANLALGLAQAPLRELGEPPHLAAESRITQALIAETRDEDARAEKLLWEALAMQEQAGVSPRQREKTRLRIANSLAAQGQSEEALALYQQILEATVARLGPEHSELGTLHFNIGLMWTELENWKQAKRFLESALELQTRSFGADSIRVAQVSATLAEVETELGSHDRAIELAEHAEAIQDGLPADHPDRNAGQAALAWALLQAGEFEKSLVANLELLDELGPAWAGQRPALHVTIAWLLCRQGRFHDAGPHVSKAELADDPVVRAKARALQVELELERGSSQVASNALIELEAEIRALPPDQVDEALLAETHWLRARIAATLEDDPARVAELVRLADDHREQLTSDQLAILATLLD